MSRINNTIRTAGNTTTILITKNDDTSYLKEVIIDTEDLHLINKVYCKSNGYVWSNGRNICHTIMNHISNMSTVIDHINGNRLDNRKENLRVLTQHQNYTNKSVSKSNIGIVGIAKRKNGNYEYFRATCSDLKTTVVEKGTYGKHGRATKKYSKQFNINKLGEEEALRQAKEWLSNKREELGLILQGLDTFDVQRLSRNGVHIKQCGSGEPIRNDSDDIVQTAWKHAEVNKRTGSI